MTALVPALVALAELRSGKKPMPASEEILACVHSRCVQLQRMQRIGEQTFLVVPARGADQALAGLVATMLGFRGVPARAWTEVREPLEPYLLVSDGECARSGRGLLLGVLTTLGEGSGSALADLLDACGDPCRGTCAPRR